MKKINDKKENKLVEKKYKRNNSPRYTHNLSFHETAINGLREKCKKSGVTMKVLITTALDIAIENDWKLFNGKRDFGTSKVYRHSLNLPDDIRQHLKNKKRSTGINQMYLIEEAVLQAIESDWGDK
ncbi:hypothetical protein [Herbaspirillum sp. ST 5-3]|uniref:hypothetical protein n=1 Tax=Oxalobacteraceae TaxID=75682 RepID=UPI0010A543F9|nr:hypothetical protein [Herbaspirillum sp. ST 5-3]